MSAWRSTHSLSATRAKGLGIGLQSSSPSVNGSYFWRVHAVNQAGEQGAFSAARSFTVTGVGAGAPATPVRAPTQGYNTFPPRESITFNWSPVANAPTYRLEVSTDPNFVLGTPATFWFDNLRTPTDTFAIADPGNYFARVFATDSDFAGVIRSLLTLRSGLLLAAATMEDFELLGVRGRPVKAGPGRGYWCEGGGKHGVQVAWQP